MNQQPSPFVVGREVAEPNENPPRLGVISIIMSVLVVAAIMIRPRGESEVDAMWVAWRAGEFAGILFGAGVLGIATYLVCEQSNRIANWMFSLVMVAALLWQGHTLMNPTREQERASKIVDAMLRERGLTTGN